MKLLKSALLSSMLLTSVLLLTSCEKEEDVEKSLALTRVENMNASKEVPSNTSGATGTITYTYRKDTRVLTYTATWTGLTGVVAASHIHGTADPGFNAGVLQNIITTTNGITTPQAKYGTSGTISATLFIDGFIFKEEHLLAGKYYLNIHTAMYPGGEIRGQITF